MGKLSQTVGKAGEEAAMRTLRVMGVRMVEHIETQSIFRKRGKVYVKKATGDIYGILPPCGKRVLAEVKTTTGDRNLRYSDLRPHQPRRLSDNAEYGGVSLLVWYRIDHGEIYVMRWPIADFEPRKSITPEKARLLSLNNLVCGNFISNNKKGENKGYGN